MNRSNAERGVVILVAQVLRDPRLEVNAR